MGGHGADQGGDNDHSQECHRIASHGKIQFHKRICKYVINADNSDKGGDNTLQISIGIAGDAHYGKDLDNCHAGGIIPQVKE